MFLAWASSADSLLADARKHLVKNLGDGGPGSLREELATAQGGDTISFAVHGTIVLTNGQLLLTKDLTIAGPGATKLAISGSGQSRVLQILPGAAVSLFALTICDGHAADGTAGISNSPVGGNGNCGGGIYNAGVLRMEQCIVSNCVAGNGGPGFTTRAFSSPDATNWIGGAGGRGGAIYNAGTLLLTACALTSNSAGAGADGGGAGQYGAAGNSGGGGGAIYNAGTMRLTACAFERNAAGHGGTGYSLIYGQFDGGQPGGSGGNGGAVCDAGQTTTSMVDCQFSFNASGAGGIGSTPTSPFSQPARGGTKSTNRGRGAI